MDLVWRCNEPVNPNAAAMNRKLTPFWTLFILTGLNLFNYLDRFVLSAVLPSLQSDLGVNDGDAGRIVTAFMLGYFVTSPLFGYLGDRASRQWLIAAGIFVWSLGTVLTGFAGGLGVLLLYRVLVGVGEASYATISPGYISDTFAPARRNNALTIFYVAIPVGAALGNILGGVISARYGWRVTRRTLSRSARSVFGARRFFIVSMKSLKNPRPHFLERFWSSRVCWER